MPWSNWIPRRPTNLLTTMLPLQTYSKELVEIPEAAVGGAESMTAVLAVITTQTTEAMEHAAAVVTMA